jgi:hypothetical protein
MKQMSNERMKEIELLSEIFQHAEALCSAPDVQLGMDAADMARREATIRKNARDTFCSEGPKAIRELVMELRVAYLQLRYLRGQEMPIVD